MSLRPSMPPVRTTGTFMRRSVQAPIASALRVTVQDLERLDPVHALLGAMNDSCVGAGEMAQHIAPLPVLGARIAHRYLALHEARVLPPLAEQIARLGNREVEALLMQYLEDLSVLKSELTAPSG